MACRPGFFVPVRFPSHRLRTLFLSGLEPAFHQAPFDGPACVLAYLGRHTHRVAISNDRLVDIDDGRVRFRWKTMTLTADAFIRCFLLPVLPPDSDRIRHAGFLANCHRHEKLALGRRLLDMPEPEPEAAPLPEDTS